MGAGVVQGGNALRWFHTSGRQVGQLQLHVTSGASPCVEDALLLEAELVHCTRVWRCRFTRALQSSNSASVLESAMCCKTSAYTGEPKANAATTINWREDIGDRDIASIEAQWSLLH